MDIQKNNPTEPISGTENVTVSEGNVNVSQQSGLIAQKINEITGRNYASDEEALKGVRETFRYVGKAPEIKKVQEALEQEFGKDFNPDELVNMIKGSKIPQNNLEEDKFVTKEIFEEATFYAKNPEYEQFRNLINALRTTTGQSIEEVVKSDNFQNIYKKVQIAEEYEKSKSIVQSNPRLGQVTDKLDKARKALSEGDYKTAKASAVDAVIDTYEI